MAEEGRDEEDEVDPCPPLLLLLPCLEEVTKDSGKLELDPLKGEGPGLFLGDEPGKFKW